MPQNVVLYRMLVASPGDCSDERKAIPKLVADWNASHSLTTSAVLETVLWETHAQPEVGERPQAILNRQIVDACDFVVGIFWTRLGTPTGVAASGTGEELKRFRANGKRVLLYFSDAPVAPHLIDLTQYTALREYQAVMRSTGLVFSYGGIHDFERLFSRHLAHLMASLTDPHSAPNSETLLRSLAKDASHHQSERPVFDALHTLKEKTRYFWPELTELSTLRDEFVTEMKNETFLQVKSALDTLMDQGHFTYKVDHAYETITDGAKILCVTVRNVTTQLKNLAKRIAFTVPASP